MSVVTVLYGPAYNGKNIEAFGKCLKEIRRHKGDACVYLVRSDVRVRQLHDLTLKELSGCFHFPVSTFPDFIRQIYSKMPDSRRILGNLEQTLLLESILSERESLPGGQFYFKLFREHPGIVTKIKEFIAGIRRPGLTSLQQIAEKLSGDRNSLRPVHQELITILTRYNERLNAAHVIDDTGIFLEMAEKASSGRLDIRQFIPSPELLVLEGYYELTLPEQQIFTVLCEQFEQTIVTLDLPFNPYNLPDEKDLPKPFHIFQDFVHYIQQSGFSLREFSYSPLEASALSFSKGEQETHKGRFFVQRLLCTPKQRLLCTPDLPVSNETCVVHRRKFWKWGWRFLLALGIVQQLLGVTVNYHTYYWRIQSTLPLADEALGLSESGKMLASTPDLPHILGHLWLVKHAVIDLFEPGGLPLTGVNLLSETTRYNAWIPYYGIDLWWCHTKLLSVIGFIVPGIAVIGLVSVMGFALYKIATFSDRPKVPWEEI